MLVIGNKPKPTWFNLSDPAGDPAAEGDVRLHFRYADGADEGMAETNARARIRQIVESHVAASEYGLEHTDWAAAISDGKADLFVGIGLTVFAVELAMLVGDEMAGVATPDGKPAAWTRRNVALLFLTRHAGLKALPGMKRLGSTYADIFMGLALGPVRKARAEGKD